MNQLNIHSYNELRRQILLAKNNPDHHLQFCLTQVWYSLLCCDDRNWRDQWHHGISGDCQTKITRYFNK